MVWTIIRTIDIVSFILMLFGGFYLLVFGLYSLPAALHRPSKSRKKNRIAVLFPAYKEDGVIVESVRSFLEQDYPGEMYDVVVISDHMTDETNRALEALPVRLLMADYAESTKAKALNLAVDSLEKELYDIVVILDADNQVDPVFLSQINNTFNRGVKAVQAHRVAKNRNTNIAVLDAVSEEINNSIFRKGHIKLGFSSALIGSGMAFDYKWFAENIKHVSSTGEDKELEALLLRQRIYIDYLDDVYVYDEKTQKQGVFYKQRRRWLAAQFGTLARFGKDLPGAIVEKNWDLCDKLVQWMLLPRVVTVGLIFAFAVAMTLISWTHSIKWWLLLLMVAFALAAAIPDYMVDEKLRKAVRNVPVLGFMMVLNMFRLKGANKKFIHTEHSNQES